MKTNRIIIVISLLLFSPIFNYATTIMVSNIDQLTAAVASATPGDKIVLKDGNYIDFLLQISTSGTKDQYIEIEAEHGGKAKFGGEVGILISGNYIRLSGFNFKGSTIPASENLIEISGNYNIVENMFIADVSNGTHLKHRYVLLNSKARHNLIDRCWFEKETQHGIVIFGDYDADKEGYFNTIQNCYFKAKRQPENGGSAMRFGTGGKKKRINGNTTIKNNLFDHYDGENEIISLKSANNIVDGNTFTNCWGQLTCRHYHNNTISNNFFLTTMNRPDGDCLAIWGEGHKVLNNYFANTKTRFSTGGSISFNAGTTEIEPTMKHEAVANVLIKNNIIYNANSDNYAISFGYNYQKGGNLKRIIMPKNITLEGNYIYTKGSKEQIYYQKPCENIVYINNQIFPKAGIDPLPKGISEINPNLKADSYGIYRAEGKGPKGNPLAKDEVGPQWLK